MMRALHPQIRPNTGMSTRCYSHIINTRITCLTSTQTTTDLERVFTLSYGQNTPRVGSLGGRIPVNKRWIDIGADVDNRFQHSCCFALLAYFAESLFQMIIQRFEYFRYISKNMVPYTFGVG